MMMMIVDHNDDDDDGENSLIFMCQDRLRASSPYFDANFALAPNFNPTLRVHPLERDFLRFRENANYDFSPQNIRPGQGDRI